MIGYFQKYLHLIVIILLCSCTASTEMQQQENSEQPDTAETVTDDRPVLPDESGTANENFQPDTFRYFGYDYEGDTVIYEEKGKIIHEGTLSGEFVAILRADYMHLIIRDSLGRAHTFWLWLDDVGQMDNYYEGKEPGKGQKLRIHWRRENTFIEEARDYMILYKAISVEVLPH